MPQRGCSAVSQRLRRRVPLLNLSHLKAGNAHNPKSSLLVRWLLFGELLPLSPPSVCAEELAYKPQTGWLVLGALWLYYIVNFGLVLTLTAFPWLVETVKYTEYIYTISRLQSGEGDTPSGQFSIFSCLNGYCDGDIGPFFPHIIKICFFTIWYLSDHRYLHLLMCLYFLHQINLIFFSASQHHILFL